MLTGNPLWKLRLQRATLPIGSQVDPVNAASLSLFVMEEFDMTSRSESRNGDLRISFEFFPPK